MVNYERKYLKYKTEMNRKQNTADITRDISLIFQPDAPPPCHRLHRSSRSSPTVGFKVEQEHIVDASLIPQPRDVSVPKSARANHTDRSQTVKDQR